MAGWTVDRKVAESAWTTAVSTELKKAAHWAVLRAASTAAQMVEN
jgi:hypothetical protein